MKRLYTFVLYFKDFIINITELIRNNLWLKTFHVLVVSQFGELFLNFNFHLNTGRYMDQNSKLSCYNCTELCDQAHVFQTIIFKSISKPSFVFLIFSSCIIIAQ